MGNDEGEVFGIDRGFFQEVGAGLTHDADRLLEDLFPVHFEEMLPLIDGVGAGWDRGTPSRLAEDFRVGAVGAADAANDPHSGGVAPAQDRCAGTIAKKDASGAVFKIEDAAQFFGTDDKGLIEIARLQHAGGNIETINKTGTGRLNIEGGALGQIELTLNQTCGGGEGHVGRHGGHQNEINFRGVDTGVFNGTARRGGRHMAGVFVLRGKAALADAGAGLDPLVGGFHELRHVVIGHDSLGQVGAGSEDDDRRCGWVHRKSGKNRITYSGEAVSDGSSRVALA